MIQDLSGLQIWLENHADQLEVLQLHACDQAALTSLPCCAKLQDLLLHGIGSALLSLTSRTWGDIASATKLTSLSLKFVQTASQQADVVAALTALPNLEHLTWYSVNCRDEHQLSDSSLLQQMTQLTSLDLQGVTAAALQHLGFVSKLQHLSISDAGDCTEATDYWTAGCPGLQELKALTSLKLQHWDLMDVPASASQLTALRQLVVCRATSAALNQLQVLTGLTQLCVWQVMGLSPESPPLTLPGLQHLELFSDSDPIMPMSYLASCTQLQLLNLQGFELKGRGSLVASTMLQHLELNDCILSAAGGAADPISWQQIFPAPGTLPHLTSLEMDVQPALEQADIDRLVECCSNLQVLHLYSLCDSFASALARLSGLTNLRLIRGDDDECSALVQLTRLRQLKVPVALGLSGVGLRQLAALNQLTSLGFGTFQSQLNSFADHLMKDDLPGSHYAIINKVCVWCCV